MILQDHLGLRGTDLQILLADSIRRYLECTVADLIKWVLLVDDLVLCFLSYALIELQAWFTALDFFHHIHVCKGQWFAYFAWRLLWELALCEQLGLSVLAPFKQTLPEHETVWWLRSVLEASITLEASRLAPLAVTQRAESFAVYLFGDSQHAFALNEEVLDLLVLPQLVESSC